ncbi:MAG: Arabinose 5-phosphate isomerase KdsD [Deltaproteobacteria bacterium ADurb.Bin510]|nr:MAG: Arabinose 5-phosphate isomerase KdsD [Deltaproteobacteria bacterium ADurb.Bin510]
MTLATVKGFDRASFRDYHPAGSLGQQLLQCVGEVMLTGERLPWVNRDASLATVLEEMTAKRLGLTLVGTSPAVAGLITDGDLRRALLKHGQAISTVQAAEIMTVKPAIISSSLQAFEALELMESRQITALLVGDDHDHLEGVVHLHDLLGRGRLGFK